METALRVCANCRVLVEPAGDVTAESWQHVPEFAQKFSRNVCDQPAPGRPASGSEVRFGMARTKTPGKDKNVIKGEIPELAVPAGEPVIIGVDGSYKLATEGRVIKPMSWAYLTTNGIYGLGTSIVPGTVSGEQRALQAELRAMAAALHAVGDDHPLTILSDSKDAIGYMHLWRDGHEVWPGGYNTERAGGRESTLARLARRIRRDPDRIKVEWVRGHAGHPLNEAADSLARIARAWTTGRLERDVAAADARRIVRIALGMHAAAAS